MYAGNEYQHSGTGTIIGERTEATRGSISNAIPREEETTASAPVQVVSGAVCLRGRSQTTRAGLRQEPHMMSTPDKQPRNCVSLGGSHGLWVKEYGKYCNNNLIV